MASDLKAVEIRHAQAGSVLSRPDGSVKLSYVTPELRPSEAGALLALHGKNVWLKIIPEDVDPSETINVATERESKSPSSRLRAVIYLLWKEEGQQGVFEVYYQNRMERIIEKLKEKLPE